MKKAKSLHLLIAIFLCSVVSVSAQEIEESKYGADSATCVANISLYREYFKQWEASKYSKESMSPEMVVAWRDVFFNCPRSSELIYTNGAKIMDFYIRNEKNVAQRNLYIDTLNMLHDARILYFPTKRNGESQVASILGRKGYDIYIYNKGRYEEAYNVLKEAVALDVNQVQVGFLNIYFNTVTDMADNGKIEKMTVIETYQELSDVLDDNIKVLASSEKDMIYQKDSVVYADAAAVANIEKEIAKIDKQILNYKGVKNNLDNRFQPFASCEDLNKVFTAKMAEKPDDVDLLKKITTILDRKDCTDSKLFLDASIKLYKLEPSPESAYNIGIQLFKDSKFAEAAKYFDEATSSENNDRVYRAYRYLAYSYMNIKNYGRSRDAARKAAAVDPTAGEPYLIIGNLYAATAKEIGSGDFYGRVAYWAAVDKYNKAKQIDPSVADKANELIGIYSQHYPTAETIFFNDFAEGESFTVEGWINERTTIRAAK
jgi:hypothetical protein